MCYRRRSSERKHRKGIVQTTLERPTAARHTRVPIDHQVGKVSVDQGLRSSARSTSGIVLPC